MSKSVIGITMGDPAGVGPEVICKALADMSPDERSGIRIFGNRDVLQRAAGVVGAALDFTAGSNSIAVEHVPFAPHSPATSAASSPRRSTRKR